MNTDSGKAEGELEEMNTDSGKAEGELEEINPFDKRWEPNPSDIKNISYRRQDVWEGPVSLASLQ